jgi:hypothetical protein
MEALPFHIGTFNWSSALFGLLICSAFASADVTKKRELNMPATAGLTMQGLAKGWAAAGNSAEKFKGHGFRVRAL